MNLNNLNWFLLFWLVLYPTLKQTSFMYYLKLFLISDGLLDFLLMTALLNEHSHTAIKKHCCAFVHCLIFFWSLYSNFFGLSRLLVLLVKSVCFWCVFMLWKTQKKFCFNLFKFLRVTKRSIQQKLSTMSLNFFLVLLSFAGDFWWVVCLLDFVKDFYLLFRQRIYHKIYFVNWSLVNY